MSGGELLPLVSGCLAMIIRGENTGAIVECVAFLEPYESAKINGQKFRNVYDENRWLIKADKPLSCSRHHDASDVASRVATAPPSYLMRLDGHDENHEGDRAEHFRMWRASR